MANPVTQIILTAVDRTKAAFASLRDSLRGSKKESADASAAFTKSGSSIAGMLSRLGLSFSALYSIPKLGGMLDDFSNIQARLKLASRSTEEYNQANADLIRIAETAKVPLAETATLYTRIASSVKDLNVSQEQIAATTEAVALSLRISGASSAESSSAMLQFSQAIASGVLRGEEFNAITESAPRLLQALAVALKVPVGELREMAKEGKLTRDVLINGLMGELPTLRNEVGQLPETIGSAFTALKNQILLTFGEMDKATGISRGLAETIGNVGKVGIQAFAVLGANVAFVFKGIGREIGGIAAQIAALARGDLDGFKFIGKAMKEDAAEARRALDEFEKKTLEGDTKLNEERQQNSDETTDTIIRDRKAEADTYKKNINEQIDDAQRLQKALISAFSTAIKAESDYLRQAKKLRDEAKGTGNVGTDPESQAKATLDATIAAMKLQREAGTASLETVQDQAEALREMAGQIADVAKAEDYRRQANLAEAAALERAAAEEKARYQGLAEQQARSVSETETLKAALDGIGKEVSVEIKPGAQMAAVKQDLSDIVHLLEMIKANPVSLSVAGTGGNAADTLRTAALQHGRRR